MSNLAVLGLKAKNPSQLLLRATALALLFGALFTGCSSSQNSLTSGISVEPSSSDVTYEAYSAKKIVINVPPGNRNVVQPELPSSTQKRFGDDPVESARKVEQKYRDIVKKLLKDQKTLEGIKAASAILDIDPLLVLGCIIGEHTYNVTIVDDVQTYGILAASWAAKWTLKFRSNGVALSELVKEPQFLRCDPTGSQAEYWDCVGQVWESSFRGRTLSGVTYVDKNLKFAFFDPISSGTSYGLGQLDPIRALMATDIVSRQLGGRMLSIERPTEVYEALINPATGVQYIAANVRIFIDRYRELARFDISKNPGLVATLYNLGAEKGRANFLFKANVKRLSRGEEIKLPEENYYGWFINTKEAELRRLFKM